ncbi:hypothetical protein OSB04_002800 [Centaurea solstitialis]|uniref:Uncharacterized protein ycf33 n=1 Tax=Centaurea solstitialis TaxID=347529 RepID=A0AA38TU07_9ASTR|nr:hypothetical protein OSB04_002800 [Centaurea solstitialis]
MKSFTLRSQFYIPTHLNLITFKPKSSSLSIRNQKPTSQTTKSPSRTTLVNRPLLFDSERVKITTKSKNSSSIDEEPHFLGLSTKSEKLIPYGENSRYVIVGAVSVGLMMLLMGSDDHQKALAFGPEGPLMEDFWDNMRRYGLYALTVSSGVLYAVFQPLYELLKNPISAILVLTILGGGFYIVSQVVSAMVEQTPIFQDLDHPKITRSWFDHSMADDGTKDALLKRGKEYEVDQPLVYPPSISTDQLISLKQVSLILAVYLTLGTICFSLIQDQISGKKTNKILDAVYFCVITMTAAGYGDVGPQTNLAKSLACVFVFTGMALGGFALSKAADYIVGKQEILFVKAIHVHETYGPNEILKETETNKVKYKFLTVLTLILFLMTIGTLVLSLVERLSYFEAFYCVCATITTLGYGEKSFSTLGGRLFAIFWILITTVSLAQLFVYLVEMWTENRRKVLVRWVLNRKLTIQDLEKADLDNDKVVSAAEYIVYKLREMGKVSDEDIAIVVEGFKNLDVDHSGTLTVNDIELNKPSEA